MPSKNRPGSFTPRNGGKLMSRVSAEVAGIANYVVKQDFRRVLDEEIRREGHDWFHPNLAVPIGNQPYPQNQTFNLAGFTNGGFEDDSNLDGIPDGWIVSVGAGITFSLDSDAAVGVRAAKFVSTTAGATGYIESASFLPALPGSVWQLAWKSKITTDSYVIRAGIVWYNAAFAVLSLSELVTTAVVTGSYSNFTFGFTVPVGAVYGKVRLTGKSSTSSITGSLFYDAVSVTDIEALHNPITLITQAKRPNGQMALLSGTAPTIYRWYAPDDGGYVLPGNEDGYVTTGEDYAEDYFTDVSDPEYADDYFANEDGRWGIVGTGFDANGARWETVDINGYTIFNNASDLPQTYRVEEDVVLPNYEMREAGIVLVGTIAEYNGVLMCGDIVQLKPDKIEANFAHVSGGSRLLHQNGAAFSFPFTARKANGFAVSCDGLNDYLTAPASASLNSSGDLTVEMMIKVDADVTGSPDVIAAKNNAASANPDWFLYINAPGTTGFTPFGFSLPTTTLPSLQSFKQGQWHHVAVTWKSGTGMTRIYLDGVLDTSGTLLTTRPNSAGSLTFGASNSLGGPAQFAGVKIAEARVWNVERTPQQILDNVSADVIGQTGLVGLWLFDEGTGLTAADSTGNGNTETLTAGPTWITSDASTDSFVEIVPVAAAVNGLTRTAGTATFVSVTPHKLVTGGVVKISGANDANYNGLFTVTVLDPVRFTYAVGGAPPTPDPGTPQAQGAFFGTATFNYTGMVGKTIALANGYSFIITKVVDPVKVRVAGTVTNMTVSALFHVVNATTAALTGTVSKNGTATVTGAGSAFKTQLWPGATILIPGGGGEEARVVLAIASDISLTVTTAFANTAAAQAGGRLSDYAVLSEIDYFDTTMLNRNLFFDDLNVRKVLTYVSPRIVLSDFYTVVHAQMFDLENVTAYNRITDSSLYDRVQFRVVWSANNEPLRFAATVPGTMALGSRLLQLRYQMRSLKNGDQIIVVGAGISGGALTATILYVHPDHRTFVLDTPAAAPIVDGDVSRADAIGSIVGFDDLQDDSSTIVKMADLRGILVVHKDTSIFIGRYLGTPGRPFEFTRKYVGDNVVYYKNTLTLVDGRFHVYAGRTEFYRFDLITLIPAVFEPLVPCSDTFFDQAILENTNLIFAGTNTLTKEIFFCFPSATPFKALCYDHEWQTVSTTGAAYTALASVKKVQSGLAIGVLQDWVLAGDAVGTVMRYGLSDLPETAWAGEALFSRLGSAYQSKLRYGLYGDRFYEVRISEWEAELASQANPNVTQYTLKLYRYRNAAESPVLLLTKLLPTPQSANLVPMFFAGHYFQDELIVDGVNNPLRLAARTIAMSKIASRGQQKAGLPA